MTAPHVTLAPLAADVVDEMRRRVAAFVADPCADPALRPAAVACLLVADADGAPAFVLTRRNPATPAHAGQWALPGGRLHEGESAVDAARRETAEEIGVTLPAEGVLGVLDEYPTRSGYRISPVVVAVTRPSVVAADPREVADVHVVALAGLDRADSPRFVTIPESDRPVVQLPLLGSLIHAPTAAVVHQFHQLVAHGRTVRVAGLEQPVFAWK